MRFPWMFGRNHDLFFFFFSVIIGFAVFAVTQSPMVSMSLVLAALIPTAFGAGPLHQGPTWFMYWDSKNRAHYKSSPKKTFIFYMAPLLVFVCSVAGMVSPTFSPLVLGIWFVWSIQHLVQQNVGILLLYHNPKDKEAIVERRLEVLSQQIPAVLFTLLFIRRIALSGHSNLGFDALIGLFGAWSLLLVGRYLLNLRKQISEEGKWINVPALSFWSLSVCSLWPLALIGRDFGEAFIAPVTWHWFQYLGLNWQLVRNKYSTGEINNLPVHKPVSLFLATCLALFLLNLGLSMGSQAAGTPKFAKDLLAGVLIGLVNVHYFLDAFMWRFREPYQRAAILPFLICRPQPAAAVAIVSPPIDASTQALLE
jgi:hypothetical protein